MQNKPNTSISHPLPCKTIVLGLGNLLLGDEGLGIHALRQLEKRYRLPQGVECVDGGTLGLGLLAHLDEAARLLVIDAVQTGRAPGTLVRLEAEDIRASLSLSLSMHQIGFQELLAISQLRGTAPEHVVVLGIEPESLVGAIGLSPVVEARMGELADAAAEELRSWGLDVPLR